MMICLKGAILYGNKMEVKRGSICRKSDRFSGLIYESFFTKTQHPNQIRVLMQKNLLIGIVPVYGKILLLAYAIQALQHLAFRTAIIQIIDLNLFALLINDFYSQAFPALI